jgi:hypothetical protein
LLKTALVRVSFIQNTQIRGETIAKVFWKVDTFWMYQTPLAEVFFFPGNGAKKLLLVAARC